LKTTIKHIFFDLDHTLWDFEKNSNITLSELHTEHNLESQHGITHSKFLTAYQAVNLKMWDLYNLNKITKDDLREIRFNETLGKFNVNNKDLAATLNEQYLELCPTRGHLMDGCIEILNYLKENYKLHILTNGFKKSQHIKLKTSKLSHLFDEIITPECSGYQKPHPKMYYYAMEKACSSKDDSIMIGDNLKTDIKGAKQVNMKSIWYKPDLSQVNSYKGISIKHLDQLKHYL